MPDPATETDRELLDRLLPGWVISGVGVVTGFYVQHMDYLGPLAGNGDLATTAAASALRAILARDRETRVEATTTVSGQRIIAGLTELRDQAAAGTIPFRRIRAEHWLEVQAMKDAAVLNNRFPGWTLEGSPDDLCRVVTDDRRGPWAVTGRDAIHRAAEQVRALEAREAASSHLPQPGEDGGA